jgi:periplasmic divalent cation tolerance protein
MEFREITITAATLDEARRIAEALVGERLAACANILPGAQSIYRWQGAVVRDDEVVILAKTRATLVDAVVARVKALHSYQVPCVVALPIVGANPDYLRWLEEETRDDGAVSQPK